MPKLVSSVSCVLVVRDGVPAGALLSRLARTLDALAVDFDFVLVVPGGIPASTALALKALVETLPDTTAVFLSEPVDHDAARLVGVDHAVGDHVLFVNPTAAEVDAVPALLEGLAGGYDVVVGDTRAWFVVRRSIVSRVLRRAYLGIYRRATGVEVERSRGGPRVLTRAAALFAASRPDGEVLLRARNIGAGFPTRVVPLPAIEPIVYRAEPLYRVWPRALRLLLAVSGLPLRGASYLAAAGGLLSVLYSVYVVAVYLFKPHVEAGWTTLSLQLAGMMFIFSVVLMFLSEYVIQIHAANPPRGRRTVVLREVRSPLSRRSMRLNVVDALGEFHVGAPPGAAWTARAGRGA